MSNTYACITCGASLRTDIPADQNVISCEYCGQTNTNPSFAATHPPLKHAEILPAPEEAKTKKGAAKQPVTHTIDLQQSSLSQLFTVLLLVLGIILFLYFIFNPQSMWIYLFVSILMSLPLIGEYFVPARWENIAKNETVKSHEKYEVNYQLNDSNWIVGYIGSYIFLAWSTYLFFASFIPVLDTGGGKELLCGVIAFILPMFGIWIFDKISQILGEALGHAFSKK